MAGVLLVSALLLIGVWNGSQPMSPEDLAQAEVYYEQEMEWFAQDGEEQVAQCLADEEAESELIGEPVDFGCEHMEPQREWYIHTAPPLHESLPMYLHGHATLLIFAALLIGATFTAAEMSTGSIGTWLSFEPRRGRVYASKLLAAALGMVPVSVLAIGIVIAGATLISGYFDLLDGMTVAAWTTTAWMTLRMLILAVMMALAGAVLGVMLRHTAAVLGVGVGYFIGEQVLTGMVPASQPWVLSPNLNAWMLDGTTYYVETCTTTSTGTTCDYTDRVLTLGQGAVYLAVVGAVLITLTAVVFRRRDIA